jgi:hypothetical protein
MMSDAVDVFAAPDPVEAVLAADAGGPTVLADDGGNDHAAAAGRPDDGWRGSTSGTAYGPKRARQGRRPDGGGQPRWRAAVTHWFSSQRWPERKALLELSLLVPLHLYGQDLVRRMGQRPSWLQFWLQLPRVHGHS